MKYEGRSGYRTVTPTDIDGYIQLDKYDAFIFFELKHHGCSQGGQRDALTKLVDGLSEDSKHNSVLFIATHDTPSTETIIAKNSTIKSYYWEGNWHPCREEVSLYSGINRFIKYLKEEKKEQCSA